MIYLIDTNVFIVAKNSYYRMNQFQNVWNYLDSNNNIQIIDSVFTEICKQENSLKKWAKNLNPQKIIKSTDKPTEEQFTQVVRWVESQYNVGIPRNNFIDGADSRLIAKALSLQDSGISVSVVTNEVASKSPKNPKIPNVCANFEVPCINIFDMFDKLGANFSQNSP